jgi:hypothetical protein
MKHIHIILMKITRGKKINSVCVRLKIENKYHEQKLRSNFTRHAIKVTKLFYVHEVTVYFHKKLDFY